MNMTSVEWLGFVAACFTTGAYIPQVVKTWRTRSAGDISLLWLLATCFGVALWTTYGFLIQSLPVFISSLITLLLAGSVLVMRILFTRPTK